MHVLLVEAQRLVLMLRVLGGALLDAGGAHDVVGGNGQGDIVHTIVGVEFGVGVKLVAVPCALRGIAVAGLFVDADFGEPLAHHEEVVAIAGAGEDFGQLGKEVDIQSDG